MMFATIRHDTNASWDIEEAVRFGRSLTAPLSDLPGFISCAVLATDGGGVLSIAFFEDAAGLAPAQQLLADWLSDHLVPISEFPAMAVTGEVIVQCGL